ncbi:MAG: type II toxin-antitoxin system PemK/MazF family toxin [Campylobacterales bacterium]|nr:type II toxin-antitoxin system PemK/MazF family toxin [Campylobacterales bacterium]
MRGMRYKQYEVVVVNLNPTVGTEIRKVRPCIILSPNEMNFDNVIVAPLTSTKRDYPTRIELQKDSYVVLDQIRTISTKRIIKKSDIHLSKSKIKEIKSIIKAMLVD